MITMCTPLQETPKSFFQGVNPVDAVKIFLRLIETTGLMRFTRHVVTMVLFHWWACVGKLEFDEEMQRVRQAGGKRASFDHTYNATRALTAYSELFCTVEGKPLPIRMIASILTMMLEDPTLKVSLIAGRFLL